MTSVAPLSFKSEFGYYGLRINPTFEEVVGTVRTPLRIPVPERKAKWLALGPYRNFIEDAERAYNESQYNATDYRESGAHLPEAAARIRPSDAGQDRTFDQYHHQGEAMDHQNAYEAAADLMNHEQMQNTQAARREQLRSMHGSNDMHPTIAAAHHELVEAGVPHYMPGPRFTPQTVYRAPPQQFVSAGHPQAPEFPDFRVLNMGDPSSVRGGAMSVSQNMTYERMRDFVVGPTQSS